MANSFSLLDAAESQTRLSQGASSRASSLGLDLLSAGLFLLAAYALLLEQNVALFALAFLGFAFVYQPIRYGQARIA